MYYEYVINITVVPFSYIHYFYLRLPFCLYTDIQKEKEKKIIVPFPYLGRNTHTLPEYTLTFPFESSIQLDCFHSRTNPIFEAIDPIILFSLFFGVSTSSSYVHFRNFVYYQRDLFSIPSARGVSPLQRRRRHACRRIPSRQQT